MIKSDNLAFNSAQVKELEMNISPARVYVWVIKPDEVKGTGLQLLFLPVSYEISGFFTSVRAEAETQKDK